MELLSKNLIDTLSKLHQLEVDANHAYEDVIDRLRSEDIKVTLIEFKHEHQNHLDALELFMKEHQIEPPDRTRDMKGVLIEGMTILRSSVSDEQALKAMKQNEEITNKYYEDALEDVRGEYLRAEELIEQHLADERRHYNYILSELGEAPKAQFARPSESSTTSVRP